MQWVCTLSTSNTIQWLAEKLDFLANYYVNEGTLRGQKPPLECLDLLLIKIWGLQIKGLQSCQQSNFENDSSSPGIESGPTGSSGAGAGWQTFS